MVGMIDKTSDAYKEKLERRLTEIEMIKMEIIRKIQRKTVKKMLLVEIAMVALISFLITSIILLGYV